MEAEKPGLKYCVLINQGDNYQGNRDSLVSKDNCVRGVIARGEEMCLIKEFMCLWMLRLLDVQGNLSCIIIHLVLQE